MKRNSGYVMVLDLIMAAIMTYFFRFSAIVGLTTRQAAILAVVVAVVLIRRMYVILKDCYEDDNYEINDFFACMLYIAPFSVCLLAIVGIVDYWDVHIFWQWAFGGIGALITIFVIQVAVDITTKTEDTVSTYYQEPH